MFLNYKKIFKREVVSSFAKDISVEIIKDEDLNNLPKPIQKYLRYVGVVGKRKIYNARISFTGSFKTSQTSKFKAFNSSQFNFLTENPSRFFLMKIRMFGLPIYGLHIYKNCKATMQIKIAGLFQVVNASGFEMDKGETVTILNDMCLLMPTALLDSKIQFEEIDSLTVKVFYINGEIKVSAILKFNDGGQLVNFISDDRYMSSDGLTYKNYRWSTPVSNYKNINGYNLPTQASLIWHAPDGDFCYGKFLLDKLVYNLNCF